MTGCPFCPPVQAEAVVQEGDMARVLRPKVYRRLALMIGLSGLFLGLLAQRLQGLDPGMVLRAMGEVGGLAWAAALGATWVSFRAVAGYDLTLHRHLATGIAADRAGRAGFAAIAIGQTVGLGVISGALVRWRMLPELGFFGAMRLSLLVALSFLLAWGVVGAVVLSLSPVGQLAWLAPAVLGGSALLCLAGAVWPRPWMPNLITQGRLVALAAADCLFAGLALWLLVPGDLALAAFLPVFLLALGAGLVSGAPAGLGAFEIVLLALLPGVAQADLLAGILAWRVIYYAGPALAGAVVALTARSEAEGPRRRLRPAPKIAEGGLVAQGDLAIHPAGFIAGRTRHGLVALDDVADLAAFRAAAKDEGRWPVIYKAGPRMAGRARAAGMVVLPVALEARLDPQGFRLELSSRAGLRRKLRKAAAAAVLAAAEDQPDWAALAVVNQAWAVARGGEHGFSMGRFDPAYLAGQRVMVARQGGRIVGFASFHRTHLRGAEVWTLDLLRPDPTAPDGTAQSLVMAALQAACSAGVHRLSLAAVPVGCLGDERGIVARLGRRPAGPMRGLCQFKAGFAPDWQRLYIAGPSLAALALVGGEIWDRVRHPPALPIMSPTTRPHEEYEIAMDRNPWQREEDKPA